MEDRILEYYNKGWKADKIAAQFTMHTHIVEEIIARSMPASKKKIVDVVDVPKIKKISKK